MRELYTGPAYAHAHSSFPASAMELEMSAQRYGLALACFSVLLWALCQGSNHESIRSFASYLHRCVSVYELLAMAEQSCAQGFQPWETVDDTSRTGRDRQYIFPNLSFSCDGVITGWTLKRYDREDDTRPNRGRILEGEVIALQLWKQKAGTESIYTLQTQQTHTATTDNAPSYSFMASSVVTVTAGDVFGFYIPTGSGTGGGLRVGVAQLPEHTMFTSRTAAPGPTEFTVNTNDGLHIFPLVSIEFSKFLQHKMTTCQLRASE